MSNHFDVDAVIHHFKKQRFEYLKRKEHAVAIIKHTISFIGEKTKQINVASDITLEDIKTFRFIKRGEVEDLFELHTPNCKFLLKSLEPENFHELSICIALSSLGLFDGGVAQAYIDCVQGKASAQYIVPEVKPLLKSTYGFVIFKEQIMQIVEELAGYGTGEAVALVRAMDIKRPENLAELHNKFIRDVRYLMTEDEASALFYWLEKSAGPAVRNLYLVEPATISYRLAWLKVHYPTEFKKALSECKSDL